LELLPRLPRAEAVLAWRFFSVSDLVRTGIHAVFCFSDNTAPQLEVDDFLQAHTNGRP
jgi:hypothetical protein